MIDIDGTVANYVQALREHMITVHHVNTEQYAMRVPQSYDFIDPSWPFTTVDEFTAEHKCAVRHGLYEQEQALPYAVQIITQLQQHKYDIIFATSRTDDLYGSTLAWLERQFGRKIIRKSSVYVGNKATIALRERAHVVIEDNPNEIRQFVEHNIPVLQPDYAYNKQAGGIAFTDWRQVPQHLTQTINHNNK